MRRHLLALVATLLISPFTAAADKTTPADCLGKSNSIDCLVKIAKQHIAKAPKDKDRADAVATLLAAISRAGIRDDDLYQMAVQEDNHAYSASVSWQLLVAQQGYAVRVQGKAVDANEVSRASALATLAKKYADAFDVIAVISAACDAKDGLRPEQAIAWRGLPDEQCFMSSVDAAKIDSELEGLSVLVAPMIHAYRDERISLRQSLEKSMALLDYYDRVLSHPKLPKDERDGIRFLLFFGHVLNATALSVSGDTDLAKRVIEMAQQQLNTLPRKTRSDPVFPAIKAHLAWTLAKVGMKPEADAFVRESLKKIDRSKGTVSDVVSTIAVCVETMHLLNRDGK